MSEEWRAIPGWEGLYEASSLGRVRRITKRPPHIMRPRKNRYGYYTITLRRPGVWRLGIVSILVCSAFHGPKPSPELQAAHWDGDTENNVPDNLRWATLAEQAEDKVRHGTVIMGDDHPASVLTEIEVSEIKRRMREQPFRGLGRALAKEFGVSTSTISFIAGGRFWKHVT